MTNSERSFDQLEGRLTGWEDPRARLAQALERNELELYAQPIIDLRTAGDFPIAEVLTRLREEDEPLMAPSMFLPALEYCGMMPELDRWVARHVVARLGRGSRVPCLTINISTQTLRDTRFVEDITTEITRANVSAASLAFEISERDVIVWPEWVKEFSDSAREAGFPLIFDSFGWHPASFTSLREMHVSYVKIDGVLVRSIHTSRLARRKLEAIVRMGEMLAIPLIGECVETTEVLATLKAEGVSYAQGFGIRTPAPLDYVVGG